MKSVKVKPEWHAAICYNAKSIAKISRETLDELGFKYERERSYKPYSKLMVVFPLPKYSYVFQFRIKEPVEFIINIYDTKPNPSGDLHLIEITEISKDNLAQIKKFLQAMTNKLPRKPWKFFWLERFRYAFAAPEYLKAKKAWKKMDVE